MSEIVLPDEQEPKDEIVAHFCPNGSVYRPYRRYLCSLCCLEGEDMTLKDLLRILNKKLGILE